MTHRKSKIMEIISRARRDLDEGVSELTNLEDCDSPGTVSEDLLEIRARVKALETRVDVIEERGD